MLGVVGAPPSVWREWKHGQLDVPNSVEKSASLDPFGALRARSPLSLTPTPLPTFSGRLRSSLGSPPTTPNRAHFPMISREHHP